MTGKQTVGGSRLFLYLFYTEFGARRSFVNMNELYRMKKVIALSSITFAFLCPNIAWGVDFRFNEKCLSQLKLNNKGCTERLELISDKVSSVSFNYTDNNLSSIYWSEEDYENCSFLATYLNDGSLSEYSIDKYQMLADGAQDIRYTYDSKGRLLQLTQALPGDDCEENYEYDSDGYLSRESYYSHSLIGNVCQESIKYYKGGLLIESTANSYDDYVLNNSFMNYEYTYTDNGRLSSMSVNGQRVEGETSFETIASKDVYSYSADGLSGTKETYVPFDGDFTLSERSDLIFDVHGHLIKETHYSYSWGDWEKSWTKDYFCPGVTTYDSKGRVLVKITDGRNGTFYVGDPKEDRKDEYVYDNNGNVIEHSVYSFNNITGVYTLEEKNTKIFDSSNRLLKELYQGKYMDSGSITREYRYDSDNHLIYSYEDGVATFYTYENGVLATKPSNGWIKYFDNGNVYKEELYSGNDLQKRRVFTHDSNVLNSKIQGVIMNGEHKNKILYATVYEALGSYKETYTYSKIEGAEDDEPEVPTEITIADGSIYTGGDNVISKLSYSRDFSNTNWQALYIPFSISIETLNENGLEVAELNDTHMYDRDDDGVFEEVAVEFLKLKSGSIQANYPYLVKAKEMGEISFDMADVELKAAEETSIDCSTTKQKFTFKGTYTGVDGSEVYNNHYYFMSGGALCRAADATVDIKPQRWYMKIENRDGSSVNYYAPSMRVKIDGEWIEPEETSIEEMSVSAPATILYTIDGRKLMEAPTSGMYVRDGKIIIVK